MALLNNILTGLTIFNKYVGKDEEVNAQDDVFYAGSLNLPLTDEEKQKLEDCGWSINEEFDCWEIFL